MTLPLDANGLHDKPRTEASELVVVWEVNLQAFELHKLWLKRKSLGFSLIVRGFSLEQREGGNEVKLLRQGVPLGISCEL